MQLLKTKLSTQSNRQQHLTDLDSIETNWRQKQNLEKKSRKSFKIIIIIKIII